MSAYDNDRRVTKVNDELFYLTGQRGRVMRVCGGRFEAATDPERLDSPTFPTVDEAIRSLIGDPQ